METDSRKGASREADAASWNLSLVCVLCSPGGRPARSPPSGSQGLLEEMLAASGSRAAARSESAASGLRGLSEEEGATAGADRGEDSLPSWRPQPDGEASRTEEVDGTWDPAGTGRGEQGPTRPPRRPPQGPPLSSPSQDFSFIEDTEILDSAMYRNRANLGRKRGHRAPAIRPGGTLGLSEAADSDARLFQDSTGRADVSFDVCVGAWGVPG